LNYNSIEKEIIGICICLEAIDSIANNGLVEIRRSSTSPEHTVYFHSQIHQELFLLRLLDFVKESGDSKLTGVSGSCLQILKTICENCSIIENDNLVKLQASVKELDDFLKYKTSINIWLPDFDIEARIEVTRLDLIIISGNHCKHNLSRLTGVSKKIHTILIKNGYCIPIEKIPLALDNFRDHLQDNYFIYYGSWITEIINNIRWGIQIYLTPLYNRSYTKKDDQYSYYYKIPPDVVNNIPQEWFWRLMNNIRKGPMLNPFKVHQYLKDKCSIEW